MPKIKSAALKGKVVHPHSRHAAAITRQEHRDMHINAKLKEKSKKTEVLGEKLNWFQCNMEQDKKSLTIDEVRDLIESYFERFDDELEQISIKAGMKGRKPGQHASRQDVIKSTLEREKQEYDTCGLEVPDLTSKKSYRDFSEWTGEMRFVQNLKMMRVVAGKQSELSSKASAEGEDTEHKSSNSENTKSLSSSSSGKDDEVGDSGEMQTE